VADGVVPAWQGPTYDVHLLAGELVRVPLVGVDKDLQVRDAGGARGRQPDVGPGLLARAG
jgi:hypothetical protein